LDLSDYENGGIRLKYRTERPQDFQVQFEFNHFVEDVFFYAPIVPSKYEVEQDVFYNGATGYKCDQIKTYQETDENGQTWQISEVPFSSFYVNSMGDETKVPAIRNAKKSTVAQVFDIVSMGIGISTLREGSFEIELKSIEAYTRSEENLPGTDQSSIESHVGGDANNTESLRPTF